MHLHRVMMLSGSAARASAANTDRLTATLAKVRACRAPMRPQPRVVGSARVSHHGHTGETRHSPRNGFNGFLRALPGAGRQTQDRHQIGFSVMLCPSNLKGAFDQDCHDGRQLYILSKDNGFADFELDLWRRRGSQMSPEPAYNGYQSFAYSYTLPTGEPTHVEH
jgi:hypothetical protein